MSAAPEFSRLRRLDTLGEGETPVAVTADAAERAAIATRFGLIAVDRLEAEYVLRRDPAGIFASGHLRAAVIQTCIATGDSVPATIDEPFEIRFLPDTDDLAEEEVELDAGELDTMFYTGSAIDLGEAAAETLALALDPYPRSAGAEDVLREAGVLSEDDAKPKGALADLKDLLGGKG